MVTPDINSRIATASSREDFVAIRDEIKAMPPSAEKTALQQEYMKKYSEFSRKYNEQFDIRMEYKPKGIADILNVINSKEGLRILLKILRMNWLI